MSEYVANLEKVPRGAEKKRYLLLCLAENVCKSLLGPFVLLCPLAPGFHWSVCLNVMSAGDSGVLKPPTISDEGQHGIKAVDVFLS